MQDDSANRLLDLLPEAMLLVRSDGLVRAANPAAAALIERPVSELVGRTLTELTASSAQAVTSLLKACSRSNRFTPAILSFERKDRPALSCRVEGALYAAREAETPAIVVLRLTAREAAASRFILLNERIDRLSREVNARRSAEVALQAHSEWLRVTLASIGDAVIATDLAGLVTLVNPVAEQLTGWSAVEAAGRPLDQIFVIANETTGAPVESPVSRVLREGVVVGLANHTVLIRRDGTQLNIADSAAPIRDDGGKLIGVVLVFHDTSQRTALERQLHQKTQALVEANQRKDQFLSMLAHELRNPLAPLRAGVHLLRRVPPTGPEINRIANMMERQTAHIARLVEDLVDVARVTRGTIELRRERVDLAAVLEQAVEMSRAFMDARGHTFRSELLDDAMTLDADATRLVQVFSNLLNNAAKFTPNGGRIELTARRDGTDAVISVRDNGPGIPKALLPHIFELFVQGDRSLDRTQGGLGIGLTFVRLLVERHGGSVQAHSGALGSGSEFVVRLPLVLEERAVQVPEKPSPDATEENRSAATPLRLLVVDDNVDAAEALCELLSLDGHDVRCATASDEALELAFSFEPQAMLLDIGLPGMDGYELARRIRGSDVLRESLLVAVSGYGQAQDQRLAKEAGFDHHFTKPVDIHDLRDLLETVGRQPAE